MSGWSPRNGLARSRRAWLAASGSLSARLAGQGKLFSVEVLAQGRQPLQRTEAKALGLKHGHAGYAREVVLRVDGEAVVFARSVTSHAHSLGAWRSIRGLGTRPLADVLFKRRGIVRAPMAFAGLKRGGPAHRDVARAWQQSTGQARLGGRLPARRSVFTRKQAPLLVMEVFASSVAPWCWPKPRRVGRRPVLPPPRR
jgi:chorismate lyase